MSKYKKRTITAEVGYEDSFEAVGTPPDKGFQERTIRKSLTNLEVLLNFISKQMAGIHSGATNPERVLGRISRRGLARCFSELHRKCSLHWATRLLLGFNGIWNMQVLNPLPYS